LGRLAARLRPVAGARRPSRRAVPKPIIIGKTLAQASDGASDRARDQTVTVTATFSSSTALSQPQVEYFVDNVNSTTETRSTVAMTSLGSNRFTATLPVRSIAASSAIASGRTAVTVSRPSRHARTILQWRPSARAARVKHGTPTM
jgi:hypothetical protein